MDIVEQSKNQERFENLREQAAGFPKLPGVYLMRNEEDIVIYVGKARDLRARVRTYFAGGDGRMQIEFLMRKVASLEKIVTENEQQALVLERDLISKYKPRYNIRLKDDKAFLSIRVDENQAWPRLELVRRVDSDGARYFGPYSFSYELRSLLDIIKRVIPLRTCADTVFYNRQRPCLEYQIKRCAGPCCLAVKTEEYRQWVKQAIGILEGKTQKISEELNQSMERASAELRFEDAAVIRDKIQILDNFTRGQSLSSSRGEDRDVFGLYREQGLVALSVLIMRSGRISDSKSFALSQVNISDEELLEGAVSQFYQDGRRDIPPEIVLPLELQNHEMMVTDFSQRVGHTVQLVVPERGLRVRLVKLAEVNAREHFLSSFDQDSRYKEISAKLARLLRLRQVPRRIECVDISNFQGSDIVGAIVVFYDGLADKSLYRKYKISQQDKPDDFNSIYEVVFRRLSRAQTEPDGDNALPDLLIVDGGEGQLAKACAARDQLGVSLEIVSLAKIRTRERKTMTADSIEQVPERIFFENQSEPLLLNLEDEITHFLQRIRDEVHRFVITFHRSKRAKRVFHSALDDVQGLGAERRRRLLKHYQTINRIKSADLDDLAKIGRMPKSLASKVLERLNRKDEAR